MSYSHLRLDLVWTISAQVEMMRKCTGKALENHSISLLLRAVTILEPQKQLIRPQ